MLLKKVLRNYRGGPDFKNIQEDYYYLDGEFKLTVALPVCNPLKPPRTKIINYPYTEPNWFENHHSQIRHSKYIPIHESYWFYWPLFRTPMTGELGNLRLNITLGKLLSPVASSEELGLAILEEYNDYYNSPSIGKYFKGHNTELVNEIEAHSARRATPFSDEEKQEQIESHMFNAGFPEISQFNEYKFNNIEWIKYTELRSNETKKKYVFATLLDKKHYLMANFTFDLNMPHNDKPWYKDANAAIAPIMEGITLKQLENISEEKKLLNDSFDN
mgnify:CR=1 FL=1